MRRMQSGSFLMHGQGISETLQVSRAGTVIWKEGKPVEDKKSTYKMTGNVQPVQGRDLLLVPEAQRTKENFYVWTEQNELTPKLNDHVIREGVWYQVQNIENWGSYTKIRMTREDVGPHASSSV